MFEPNKFGGVGKKKASVSSVVGGVYVCRLRPHTFSHLCLFM